MVMSENNKQIIKKIDAACRQLDTAITLWFQEGDDVSIHTLACSAHQIIHDINKSRKGRDLLFDTVVIKDEYRSEFISFIKGAYNFFKHADKAPNQDGVIQLDSSITGLVILFSILGLEMHGIKTNVTRSAFILFYGINNPDILTDKYLKSLVQNIPPEHLTNIRKLKRSQFFESYNLLMRKTTLP